MKRLLSIMLIMAFAILPLSVFASGEGEQGGAAASGKVSFALWTQEGESEGAFAFVQKLANDFMDANPNVIIEVVQKDTEALREDFQTASLAGSAPELLWTVSDHAGPFLAANLIQPVDAMFNANNFIETVIVNNNAYAVPISAGNHLMLLYNKSLVPNAPKTTDELISVAQGLTTGDMYGLVYNATEPFWLVPWLGGFDGKVFAADGVTPTLNTKAMRDTLQFLADLEFEHGVVPAESDYGTMDTLFKEGKAAMLINGDWSLGDYQGILGDDLGVAKIPTVSATGSDPAPYTSGKYFMVAEGVSGAKLDAVKSFIQFATSEAAMKEMVETLVRLPARLTTLQDPLVTSDPILKGSAEQLATGTPQPTNVEMRAVWDAMKPEMNAVLAGTKDAAAAAAAMQAAAEATIATMQ
ncbi:extracellular solute-binding protein [Spirochaeta lutea]|uniref:Sugar ABC transporter substrate-binding protein n=1 Tax=Spirochaeta lutea TaxID=1480694 RepID=A0A098QY00_9SPIO|nr:extracellular solute-binding protein [Spirochaeta lutea]KGE72421.1 sugar ABC transporter substrate-binding protein [Spirochaeta lutea]